MKFQALWAAMMWAAVAVFAGGPEAGAQADPDDTGPAIDRTVKAEIIDSVTAALDRYYVFPDVAKKMGEHARRQLKKGAYDTLATVGTFARGLSEDLLTVCHDRHFGLRYVPRAQLEAMLDTINRPTAAEELRRARLDNFGFRKAAQLPGHVGYLKLDGFSGLPEARATAVGAMHFLAHTDALIIDLRDNGGGSPDMIQILTSYFFKDQVHLNTFYVRETDSLQQFWTTSYVDGEKMADVPLYVLTSGGTFSAAEEFTYNLKNLKRATVVGETTGGGAHPVATHGFPNLEVGVRVPFGRAINPISGTNWEGTGIAPDIACAADRALEVALLEAYRKLKAECGDEQLLATYDWQIDGLEAQRNPVTLEAAALQEYVGDFGPRRIALENGALVYQREGNPKFRMTPMGGDLFMFADIPYFRLKFVRDAGGGIVAVEGHYEGGQVDRNERT